MSTMQITSKHRHHYLVAYVIPFSSFLLLYANSKLPRNSQNTVEIAPLFLSFFFEHISLYARSNAIV